MLYGDIDDKIKKDLHQLHLITLTHMNKIYTVISSTKKNERIPTLFH